MIRVRDTKLDAQQMKKKLFKVTASRSCHYCALLMCVQRLNREARVWHALEHPNILKFLGVVHNMGDFFALVSPYCAKGNIVAYLEEYPQTDRFRLVTSVPQFIPLCINFLVRSLT